MQAITRLGLAIVILIAFVSSIQGISPRASNVVSSGPLRQVNVPKLDDPYNSQLDFARMAIFWFGRVDPTSNFVDVRVGYSDYDLVVYVAVFDRLLWTDPNPSPNTLLSYDAVTLLLHLQESAGNAPNLFSFRFIAGSRPDPEDNYQSYQIAYRGTGSGWSLDNIAFMTKAGWRGDSYNNDGEDRGWAITFKIPFASLGQPSPPAEGTVWRMALFVHDRDDAQGTPIPDAFWPEQADINVPASWGRLRFGIPTYTPPLTCPSGSVTIRHRLNGVIVQDASVGGYTNCGNGTDFWTQWGDTHESFYNPDLSDFNIQNQSDIADWPCFSKYYVTFPLDAIPLGKVILAATLTLHLFGNAGGGEWGEPPNSWIQILTVSEDWNDQTITWNTAPLASENIGATWVYPVREGYWNGWPGIPYTWYVTYAVAKAYAVGQPLRLALYSADSAYHSGKYFVSSDTGDWNAAGRPTLRVVWGEP